MVDIVLVNTMYLFYFRKEFDSLQESFVLQQPNCCRLRLCK